MKLLEKKRIYNVTKYHQAGNSIVVDVLEAILKQIIGLGGN